MKTFLLLLSVLLYLSSARAECLQDAKQVLRNVFLNRMEGTRTLAELRRGEEWTQLLDSIDNAGDKKWLHSNLFYDRDQIALHPGREGGDLVSMWDEGWFIFKDKPLSKFEKTLEQYIVHGKKIDIAKDFDIDLIAKFNGMLMEEKGLFKEGGFGKVRTETPVHFQMSEAYAKKNESALRKNPYLRFEDSFTGGRKKVFYPKPADVKPLLEEALQDFKNRLTHAKTLEERVRIYTDFSKKLVSIHPFPDGNGRTTRFTLNFLLAQEGLPIPILEDTIDLSLSDERFFEKVITGIKTSDRFLDDIKWRKAEGLDIKKTPYNLVSKLPDQIWFSSKGLKGGKASFPVDAYDYAQYVRNHTSQLGSPLNSESKLLREYVSSMKQWSLHFVKTGKENDLYHVMRVPDEATELLKINKPKSKEGLKRFYKEFYEEDEVHRGLSVQSSYSDQQLIDHFKKLSNIHLSMSAARQSGASEEKIVSKVIENSRDYNSMIEKPSDFFSHARDHMNAEGSYGNSVFLSTSKNKAVAKRFSEGFLTGENSIKNMKGQLILSALEPKYGAVDFNRLNEISQKLGNSFMSKYPRQQEVAVVGALNPESVTRLEFKDVEVRSVKQNTGELQAGETKVSRTRVLERVKDDPTRIKFSVFDENQNLISEKIISLY